MLLVPRQLRRVGMTGNVPYYGGRFTPAQAYGASHPSAPPPSFADPMTGGAFVRAPVPMPGQSAPPRQSAPPGQSTPSASSPPTPAASEMALQQLLNSGVISQAEYEQLRARVIK
jgi:hypothetical protein